MSFIKRGQGEILKDSPEPVEEDSSQDAPPTEAPDNGNLTEQEDHERTENRDQPPLQ